MEKYKSTDSTTYSLGTSLTIELLKNKGEFANTVYLSSRASDNEQLDVLKQLCKENGVKIIVDDRVINRLSVKENCFSIGIFEKFNSQLCTNKHIVLYKFNDFGELGTIMRSATSFDFKDIVLIDCDIDYFDPRTIRSSMGGIFHLNIKEYADFKEYINDYKDYELMPITKKEGIKLSSVRFKEPYSLIIPQTAGELDNLFDMGINIEHKNNSYDMSLSAVSSILFNFSYHQNANDKNI